MNIFTLSGMLKDLEAVVQALLNRALSVFIPFRRALLLKKKTIF